MHKKYKIYPIQHRNYNTTFKIYTVHTVHYIIPQVEQVHVTGYCNFYKGSQVQPYNHFRKCAFPMSNPTYVKMSPMSLMSFTHASIE